MLYYAHGIAERVSLAMIGKGDSLGLRTPTCVDAVIRNIVGTRAETPVDEHNHNCSPILSAASLLLPMVCDLPSLGWEWILLCWLCAL